MGKTTLLAELAKRGYAIVPESARSIIAQRLAHGDTPRPEPLVFAREILGRDVEQYVQQSPSSRWTFFDRGVVEAIGMVHESSPLSADERQALLDAYPYHSRVFILPPWEEIYTTDAERDQTFADVLAVHAKLEHWYGVCGYELCDVPRLAVTERADYVLRMLDERTS